MSENKKSFDFIIIGAGSAGCVLAARLSENPAHSVCLLEAGGADKSPNIHMPIGYGKTLHDPKLSWKLYSGAEPYINGRNVPLPRGKVLGGSSSLNGMIYIRGHAEDYNSWANLGCTGWGWDDVLPYFIKSEQFENGASELRGGAGPLHVTSIRDDHSTNDLMIKAFEQYGLARNDDFNGADQEGAGRYHVTMKNGKRHSTASAYLKPARKRKNLTVLTGAMVRKINIETGQARSVAVHHKGRNLTLTANREIIVSAGAYHSPQLLQISGIGPAAYLKSVGISVHVDRPNVGDNLQDHYMAPMAWEVNPGVFTYNDELSGLALIKNVVRYYLTKRGPMTIPAAQVGAFARSDPALERPDLQFHCLAVTGDLETASRGENAELTDYPGLTLSGAVLRPHSRGFVIATSQDSNTPPNIVHNYLQEKYDQDLSVKAMKICREIAKMPALAGAVKCEQIPGSDCHTDAELLDFSRRLGTTMYHPVGTCRMGRDSEAVVDPNLKVNGIERLRVIDASVMPRLISGNTNAATIAIAEKGADLILGR